MFSVRFAVSFSASGSVFGGFTAKLRKGPGNII